MAIRTIVVDDDSILRKKCREVTEYNKRLHDLLDDLAETMHKADGVGLAAPQVGVLRRAVVIDVGEGVIELVNPEIIKKSGSQNGAEGCLSYPNEFGMVERPMQVTVKAFDRDGKEFKLIGKELLARAICHEVDHLDGVVFKDLATEMIEDEE